MCTHASLHAGKFSFYEAARLHVMSLPFHGHKHANLFPLPQAALKRVHTHTPHPPLPPRHALRSVGEPLSNQGHKHFPGATA